MPDYFETEIPWSSNNLQLISKLMLTKGILANLHKARMLIISNRQAPCVYDTSNDYGSIQVICAAFMNCIPVG